MSAREEARRYVEQWRGPYGLRRGVLKEVARGHRMAASLTRDAQEAARLRVFADTIQEALDAEEHA